MAGQEESDRNNLGWEDRRRQRGLHSGFCCSSPVKLCVPPGTLMLQPSYFHLMGTAAPVGDRYSGRIRIILENVFFLYKEAKIIIQICRKCKKDMKNGKI
jgi:hypothetical protein